jgi:hypothetical protein
MEIAQRARSEQVDQQQHTRRTRVGAISMGRDAQRRINTPLRLPFPAGGRPPLASRRRGGARSDPCPFLRAGLFSSITETFGACLQGMAHGMCLHYTQLVLNASCFYSRILISH